MQMSGLLMIGKTKDTRLFQSIRNVSRSLSFLVGLRQRTTTRRPNSRLQCASFVSNPLIFWQYTKAYRPHIAMRDSRFDA